MLKISEKDEYLLKDYRVVLDSSNGYYRAYNKNGKGYSYLHRLIMNAEDGQIVDHINQDKKDNRRDNLRIVSKKLNNYNRKVNNPNGRGIYYDKSGNRYRACISHEGKTLKLGSFKNINEAKEVYNKKAFEIYGESAFQHKLRK